MKKKFLLALLSVGLLLGLVACTNNNDPDTPPTDGGDDIVENGGNDAGDDGNQDSGLARELYVLTWEGTGRLFRNFGNMDLGANELVAREDAGMHATARAFNELHPDVSINYFGVSGSPDGWAQQIENFRAEHGRWPDLILTNNVADLVERGIAADLSRFADTDSFQRFNPTLLSLSNFYGFQASIPQYALPHGVWVNRSLAEANNIDTPPVNWTIDQFTNFISQADNETFFGIMDTPFNFIWTGASTIRPQILNHDGTGDFVDLNSDEVRHLLSYIPRWANHSLWPNWDLGNISEAFMVEHGWWDYNFFRMNRLLTFHEDPWFLSSASNPDPNFWGRVLADDWDIFPRPATEHVDNTVGIIVNSWVVFDHTQTDMDEAAALERMRLAYDFAAFYSGDTRAWQARADQEWMNNGVSAVALDDSFPMVTGADFDAQMQIWYQAPARQVFADESSFPGLHFVKQLWERGQIYDVSSQTIPWHVNEEGSPRSVMDEFENIWNPDVVGAARTDANWLDMVLSRLSEWNELTNNRFRQADQMIREALIRFHGFTEADFN